MAIPSTTTILLHLHHLLLLLLLLHAPPAASTTTLYTTTTFFSNYQKMITNLKIFIYPPPQLLHPKTTTFSLLHNSLLTSKFLTHNPNQATLFFLPFPPSSTRSLARHIQHIRTSFPHWNRSLGADHFYFSCHGVGPTSTRNVVELKKNSIQISCFPSPARDFIPHKDITLPPFFLPPRAQLKTSSTRLLGYWRFVKVRSSVELIQGLQNDPEFMIESEPSDDERVYMERIQSSKYCMFVYEDEGVLGLNVALVHGCVPVVITDRPIQDLPLMDVIKWFEIALFVKSTMKSEEFKRALVHTREDGRYERMRKLGVAASQHFAWNESLPQPFDAFHMVMYQLWLRRHVIRYSKWEEKSIAST